MDNNLVEKSIRPSAIGKKNCLRLCGQASLEHAAVAAGQWLFMGDAQTGERAATLYTLIGNCHRAGLNAENYVTELFGRLPSATTKTVRELTPHAMAAQRRATARRAATE